MRPSARKGPCRNSFEVLGVAHVLCVKPVLGIIVALYEGSSIRFVAVLMSLLVDDDEAYMYAITEADQDYVCHLSTYTSIQAAGSYPSLRGCGSSSSRVSWLMKRKERRTMKAPTQYRALEY